MEKLKLKLAGDDVFAVREAYKFLRTNLQFCGRDLKTICFTSCNENEGKTTVSLNVARSFAEMGKKVLLIDTDMRKSVIAGKYFNAKNPRGLSELLSGIEKNINNVVYPVDVEGMYIIFAGNYPPNPAELLADKTFEQILNSARDSFDYIIVDSPPLGAVTDSAIIAPLCDGAVLVIGSNNVNRREAVDVVTQLRNGGAYVMGAVRNKPYTDDDTQYRIKKLLLGKKKK